MGNNRRPLATKRKKGRPSLLDLQKRNLRLEKSENSNYTSSASKRSRRRNLDPDLEEEEDEEDEELSGRRKEKKLKLVLKADDGSDSGESGSDMDGGVSREKREIKDVEPTEGQNLGSKATVGATEDSGPTTPLPDKKLLLFILDRLQKKDIYAVFSEPVDPEELPDYHEIIENPMDFGTVRKKLDGKEYKNLEEFENDISLITTNAMRYNSPDTIYFRQAKAIQELARKDFENLRKESDDDEKEPKIARRGRPPIKHIMKRIGRTLDDHTTNDFSDAPPANGTPNSNLIHSRPTKAASFDRSSMPDVYKGYGQNKLEKIGEHSGSPLKGLSMRNWKKNSIIDENRRNTYYQPLQTEHESSILTAFDGERKQLVPVGLYTEHAYARSLARFAANLGPIGWEIAAKRIERVLPPGTKFGRGWVGEPLQQYHPSSSISSPSPSSSSSQAQAAAAAPAPQAKPLENHVDIKHAMSIDNVVDGQRLSGGLQPCRNLSTQPSTINGFHPEYEFKLPPSQGSMLEMTHWCGGNSINASVGYNHVDDKGILMSNFEGQWQTPSFNSSELSVDFPVLDSKQQETKQEPPELALQL